MTKQVFLADNSRTKVAVVLGIGMPICAVFNWLMYKQHDGLFSILALIVAAFMLVSGIYWIAVFLRRGVPVIEVSNERIECGSIYPFTKRQFVETSDVVAVHETKPWIILTTRSGGLTKISTYLLSPARALEVQDAIKQRIGTTDAVD